MYKKFVIIFFLFSESILMSNTILVTGGAGYIGSHTVLYLLKKGYQVIVLDDLSQGQEFNLSCNFIKGDFADKNLLEQIFTQNKIDAVMHFAAFIEVGESVKDPLKFYINNVTKTLTLLEVMLKHKIKKFIFSSSCAVYGIPEFLPLTEDHPKNPVSPYGQCKLMVENILKDFDTAYGLKFVSLRYFNAAGSINEHNLGERHSPETHIIPLIFKSIESGFAFKIFGADYSTRDGSCIRDYLHVWDIASAHYKALEYLNANNNSDFFNLGTGTGYSVKEIIQAVEILLDKKVITLETDRRLGDPPILVADATKAHKILDWQPLHSSLEEILKSAYNFFKLNFFTRPGHTE